LKYDSILEREFHEQFPDLIYQEDNLKHLPFTFYDSDGVSFKASPDFYFKQRNIVIELKGHQLNTIKSKKDSTEKMHYHRSRFRELTPYHQLKYGFNHSLFKQGAVNRTLRLSNYQYQFLLVFADGTELTTQAKTKLTEEKVDWCFASDWESYTFDKF